MRYPDDAGEGACLFQVQLKLELYDHFVTMSLCYTILRNCMLQSFCLKCAISARDLVKNSYVKKLLVEEGLASVLGPHLHDYPHG